MLVSSGFVYTPIHIHPFSTSAQPIYKRLLYIHDNDNSQNSLPGYNRAIVERVATPGPERKYQDRDGQFHFDTETIQWLKRWEKLTPVLGLINALERTGNFVSWQGTMTFTGPESSSGSRTVYTGDLQLQAWWQHEDNSQTTEQYSFLVKLPTTRRKDRASHAFINDTWYHQECSGSIRETKALNGSIVSTAPINSNTASTMWDSSAEVTSISKGTEFRLL